MNRRKNDRKFALPKDILLLVGFWVLMFLCYGFTLTTNTVFLCTLILRIILFRIGLFTSGEYVSLWWIYLFLGGASSLTTLHHLYNPGKEVFTNIDHHALKFTGYASRSDTLCILDGKGTTGLEPLFAKQGLDGSAVLYADGDSISIIQDLCQPIYRKEGSLNYLLNAGQLPGFDRTFKLNFRDGSTLAVRLTDGSPDDRIKQYHERVDVAFILNGQPLQEQRDTLRRFIRRSLPLTDLISSVMIPDEFPLDWSLLRGVSVVRDVAGRSARNQLDKGFRLSLDPSVLQALKSVETDRESFDAASLRKPVTTGIPKDKAFTIGSGMDATPAILPSVHAGQLLVSMDTQIKHLLPYEKDSLENKQTVMVTSDLQSMAEASTTSALYYPVLPGFGADRQFRFAIEYLPEESRTALTCKMQFYDGAEPGSTLSRRKDGTYLLHAGDSFTVEQPGRYVSPVFELVDFRSTVPFSAQKGYLLILLLMAMAGISLAAGRGRVDTRGETALWLGLMALITYRAFIAWRTSVFPPLEGISESRFLNDYLNTDYTFTMVPVAVGIFILLPSLVYKLFLLPRDGRGDFRLPGSLQRMASGKGFHYACLPVLALVIIVTGYLASVISERLAYVFFPVASFIFTEWLYQCTRTRVADGYAGAWKIGRYLAMFLALPVPLLKDTGFGIVFLLFLLLYLALENLLHFEFNEQYSRKDPLSMFYRRVRGYLMVALLVFFVLLMVAGPRMVSLLFNNFHLIAGGMLAVLAVFSFVLFQYLSKDGRPGKWKYAPLAGVVVFFAAFVLFAPKALEKNRHFLYRSEIHFKPIDDILMDNSFGSRDLERLFEAAQNQWYLGYYMKDRSWEQAVPFSKPYDLRSHFNKGVTWDTQKTDVVLNRYVIGEHSIWSVYVIIILFILLFGAVFVSQRRNGRYTLLGCGAILLLLCQCIFITMAVTNRFIFFGQDFPLISQHSLLTLLYTSMLFGTAILTTLKPVRCEADTVQDNLPDKRSIGILAAIFLLVLFMDPSLSDSGRSFNVGDALRRARMELEDVNRMLAEYQSEKRDELARDGIIRHFLTDEELEARSRSRKRSDSGPKFLQSDYSAFMHRFDEKKAAEQPGNDGQWKIPGVSNFTASLYRIYRDQLSKDNKSTDIIHLKADQSGKLQLNIAMGYYLLTTPETDEQMWQGDLLPVEKATQASVLTINSPVRKGSLPFGSAAARLDRDRSLSYDFPIYLAKLDNRWTAGGEPVFIGRSGGIPITIKNGATAYRIPKAGAGAHYLVLQNDDCIETVKDDAVGNRGGTISVKGDVGKYFARNMLVNGRRELVFPLGDKFFYPYHVSRIAQTTYSGADPERRKTDVRLSLSYSMTEEIYEAMAGFEGRYTEPHARGVVVADGDGHIKAMVTVKNPYRNSGYYRVNPNDGDEIGRLTQQFYLNGDNLAEEHTFGDMNLNYMMPGPGSSIKPITFTSVVSKVCYDWRKLQLYFDPAGQNLKLVKGDTHAFRYSDIRKNFYSPTADEQGINGYTGITQYMKRSSNFFNSLMVFMGFYQPEYLRNELARIRLDKMSEIFTPYKPGSDISFPAFTLRTGDGTRTFNFTHYVTKDGLGPHSNGALAQGFESNFGLYSDYPQNLPSYTTHPIRDIIHLEDTLPARYYQDYAYAFNRVSYLPDKERTTFQGSKDAITNTTLGASPFAVTPAKMAEMFGRLFSQNKAYRLTLAPDREPEPYEAFDTDPMYGKSGTLYQDILANYLFKGMSQVVAAGGTATNLDNVRKELEAQGYYLYGKTGTISHRGDAKRTQLLGLVISRVKLHDTDDLQRWEQRLKGNRFYVLYFSNAEGYHNYGKIIRAIRAVVGNAEFRSYMEGTDSSID